jgi:bacterial/archaeal transporter family protein
MNDVLKGLLKDVRVWALLSAFFAALTALWGKKGIEGIPSNYAVAIRVSVIVVVAWLIAWINKDIRAGVLSPIGLLFLTLSGLATGASWLCYYRALQMGSISQVAPIDKLSFVLALLLGVIFLRERPTWNIWLGAAFIVTGVLFTLYKPTH